MRIIISTDKLNRGGKEKQLLLLANGLRLKGNQLRIVSKNRIDYDNFYDEIQFPTGQILILGKGNRFTIRKRFYNVIREFQPEVILNFDVMTSLWTERLVSKLKNVTAINCTIRRATPYNSFKSRILAKMCLRRSTYIIANSHAGLALYNIQKNKRHTVIYNGIDLKICQKTTPLPYKLIFGKEISDDAFVIANIGSLFKHKGQHTLVDAIAKLKSQNIFAVIIGEGPEKTSLQSKIDNYGLSHRVILTGRQSNAEEYLKSADLYVNTSWGEGCSNAILEAMACDLPVITTLDGGTKEIIHEKSTLLFKKNDAQDLSEAIKKMASRSEHDSSDLQQWLNQYECSKMVDQYETYINKVVLSDH